ncbi:hypothetical protein F170042I7_04790 [Blautia caecimuris]
MRIGYFTGKSFHIKMWIMWIMWTTNYLEYLPQISETAYFVAFSLKIDKIDVEECRITGA